MRPNFSKETQAVGSNLMWEAGEGSRVMGYPGSTASRIHPSAPYAYSPDCVEGGFSEDEMRRPTPQVRSTLRSASNMYGL